MPNIFKRFSPLAKAALYEFPDAKELLREDEEEEDGFADLLAEIQEEIGPEEDVPQEAPEVQEEEEPENPIDFAQVQADMIRRDAYREAEEIVAKARLDAELEAEAIRAAAREDGEREGYARGLERGRQEAAAELEERAAQQAQEVQKFLEQAGAALDRQMDESVNDLRDLAMAVAEKVVCVSLKSSADVICRMIQTAIDKRKRREWVHIYIADCDARRMGQVPAPLSAALSALSGRVRIIPMADDDSGTCIIEMPDEIIDASAATQLNNIRGLLLDAGSGAGGGGFF